MKKRILIVAAHSDDEILGCGGTVSRLLKEGYQAYTLILGEGITSRDKERERANREKEIEELRKQAYKANKIIGVKKVFIHNFPDNRFDSTLLLDIVKVIEKVKNQIKPEIIFTHYARDLNIDHQITFKAVITATRPVFSETVKDIYSFEVLSSTEWNYPLSFSPSVYFDIGHSLEYKLKAVKKYKSELRNFPHPRSIKAIKLNAEYRGMQVGLRYAEAFEVARIIR